MQIFIALAVAAAVGLAAFAASAQSYVPPPGANAPIPQDPAAFSAPDPSYGQPAPPGNLLFAQAPTPPEAPTVKAKKAAKAKKKSDAKTKAAAKSKKSSAKKANAKKANAKKTTMKKAGTKEPVPSLAY